MEDKQKHWPHLGWPRAEHDVSSDASRFLHIVFPHKEHSLSLLSSLYISQIHTDTPCRRVYSGGYRYQFAADGPSSPRLPPESPYDGVPSPNDQARIGGCPGGRRKDESMLTGNCRVRFPGAINSKFTSDMKFIDPNDSPDIPTYRVIDSDGVLVDKKRGAPKVSDETVLTWYKNMLTGGLCLGFWRG